MTGFRLPVIFLAMAALACNLPAATAEITALAVTPRPPLEEKTEAPATGIPARGEGSTPDILPTIEPSAEPSPRAGRDAWKPPLEASWQWQLAGEAIDLSFDVDLYDVDLFDTPAEVVSALHAQGSKVVCYLSAGSWEEWRPDADQFPAEVIGRDYEGWPGEKWLDIRRIDLLGPVMLARLDLCRDRGFDAVEPDNIDGYDNDTGFPLTYADQMRYNLWLAEQAHARGLSIGLKNDPEQAAGLEPFFDWALTEDCFDQGWCEKMLPFIQAGKPVFAAEYTDSGMTLEQFCPQAEALNFNAILKRRELDAWREACP